jgi:hypothetical protein
MMVRVNHHARRDAPLPTLQVIWTNTTRKNSQLNRSKYVVPAFASALGQLLLKKPRRCDADRQALKKLMNRKSATDCGAACL